MNSTPYPKIAVTSISASTTFYLAAFVPLGYNKFVNFDDKHVSLAASGKPADLWLKEMSADGLPVKVVHLAFEAESREVVDTFCQAVVYVLSALVKESTLNNLLTNFSYRKAGGKKMGHQERGTTSLDIMQHLSPILMVTISRWFAFNGWTNHQGGEEM